MEGYSEPMAAIGIQNKDSTRLSPKQGISITPLTLSKVAKNEIILELIIQELL